MSTEIYHYGVLGMKWGVRRYRNKDGSLTAAGKKHRDKMEQIRNEEAGRYKRMADSSERSSKRETELANRLKYEGQAGETMKKMYGFTDDETAIDMFGQKMKDLWRLEIDEAEAEARIERNRVEAYMNANKALLDMDVSMVRGSDIYKLGLQTVNRTFNDQANRD